MLRKLTLFKQIYANGKEIASIQEDVKLRNSIKQAISNVLSDYNIKSVYTNSGRNQGRASFCFLCYKSNECTFLKANIPGYTNKLILQKEYEIYSNIFKDIVMGFYSINNDLAVLELKYLDKRVSLSHYEARELIEQTLTKLKGLILPTGSYYDIETILSIAMQEIIFINNKKLITHSYGKAIELLSFLSDKISSIPRMLCHGDYSDVNILMYNNIPIIIDWEDAFYGIPNYDYLFWLSFFNHRKYYSKEIFGMSKDARYFNIAVMIMILIIKEAMSVYNGEYKNNKLTAEDRVAEVLSFLE